MSRPMGTAAELERRRCRAVQAVSHGQSPEAVARALCIARGSMYRWLTLAEQPDGLAAKPHSGPTPRLPLAQHHDLEGLLHQRAHAHGWPNRLSTFARVAQLLRR